MTDKLNRLVQLTKQELNKCSEAEIEELRQAAVATAMNSMNVPHIETNAAATSSRVPRTRNLDINISLKIGMTEAYNGCTKTITYKRRQYANGEKEMVKHQHQVVIPPGTPNDSEVTYENKGDWSKNGKSIGKLVVKITIAPEPRVETDEFGNLLVFKDISLSEYYKGCDVELWHPSGWLNVRIDEGIASDIYCVDGMGLNKDTHLFVYFNVIEPTSEQIEQVCEIIPPINRLDPNKIYIDKEIIPVFDDDEDEDDEDEDENEESSTI